MAISIRRGRPDDVERLKILSDRVFRPGLEPGTGMGAEFPLLFHPDNAANLYFAADGSEAVSLVATYKSLMAINGARLDVLSIGSVATLPEYRGQGLATRILETVMDDARPHHPLMLVSGDRGLYLRLGCVFFGSLVRARVRAEPQELGPWTLRQGDPGGTDAALAHGLHRTEPYRYLRTPGEMASLLGAIRTPRYRNRTAPTQLWFAESDGTPQAYLVGVRSRDGRQYDVLEWGGNRGAVVALIRQAAADAGAAEGVFYLQPDDQTGLACVHRAGGETVGAANQGTVKVLNPEGLLAAVEPLVYEKTGHALEWGPGGRPEVTWIGGSPPPVAPPAMDEGLGALAVWLFGRDGLELGLAHTANLNYV